MATSSAAPPQVAGADPKSSKLGMYAGFVTRAAALMLDIVLIVVAVLVINALIGLPVAFFTGVDLNNCAQSPRPRAAAKAICATINLIWVGVALLASPIYFITLFTTTGQTIGKYVMGIRVVRLDGRAMTFKTGAVRWLGYFVSAIPLGLGFFWVIVDNRQQGFHDRLAGTSVIYAWRATGSERLLERVRTRFGTRFGTQPHAASVHAQPAPQPTGGNYELLAFSAPDLNQIDIDFHTVNEMVANREIAVLATDLLRKTADGQVSSIRTDSLPSGTDFNGLTGLPTSVTPNQIATVASDFPAASYILAVLLEDRAADVLVRQLTRGTSVLVRRCNVPANSTPVLPSA
jgi:uncharacterized RDD family membrane protein YckC